MEINDDKMIEEMKQLLSNLPDWINSIDKADLEEILHSLEQRNYDQAGDQIIYLDTIIRELIPDYVYDSLNDLGLI